MDIKSNPLYWVPKNSVLWKPIEDIKTTSCLRKKKDRENYHISSSLPKTNTI
jgi:hypothetical protein